MKKKKKNKNRSIKRKIIGILCAIAALAIMFAITFIVFGGNEKVSTIKETKVPVIKGMTINQATVALEREGLILVEAGTEISSETEGSVIESDPRAGATVQSGDEIRVIVSSGEEKVDIPDFKDSKLDVVKAFFKKNGITDVDYVEQFDNNIAVGLVIKTEPAAKTKVTKSTKVTVYTSKGVEKKYVKVPNLTGYNYDEAESKLKALGLIVTPVYKDTDNENQDGKILVESSVDKSVEVGTTITLTVAKYKAPIVKSYTQDDLALKVGAGFDGVIAELNSFGIKYVIKTKGTLLEEWSPKDRDIKVGETVTLYFN